MGFTEWEKLIQIDRTWVSTQLSNHFAEVNRKVSIKLYTVKVSGTQMLPDSIAETLHLMLPDYVYSKHQIEQMGERKASLKSNHFFGRKDPQSDGKYGELLLFALVEGVLGCKMIAHKIRSLSNFKDQVKGGDGVFLGDYTIYDGRVQPAYLIGESKIMAQFSSALKDSLDSLDRFNGIKNSTEFRNTELIVAKENLMVDDSVDINELYDRLNPTSSLYKDQIIVHPVLLMYNDSGVKKCEKNENATRQDFEDSIKEMVKKKKSNIIRSINKKIADYPSIGTVYLEFFLVPYNDVDNFRNTMYQFIHGVAFPEKK